MAIVTLRPNADGSSGFPSWSKVGSSGSWASIVSDDSDSTYMRSSFLFGGSTLSPFDVRYPSFTTLPDGAKIVGVRVRNRIRTELEGTGEYHFIIKDTGNGNTVTFVRTRSVAAGIGTVSESWRTTRPGTSQEWTVAAINGIETLYSGKLPAGGETDTRIQVLEAYLDIDYNERPVATYTGPTGTVTDTSRPTITWDYSDPESDAQSAYRIIVTYSGGPNDGQVAYDSGWVSSSVTSRQIDPLTNDQSYDATIQVRQVWSGAGTHESLVDGGSFSLSLDAPDAPVLMVTPDPDNARMIVEVDDLSEEPTPASEWMIVEFSDEGPSGPWTTLRGAGEVLPSYPVTLYDHEVRFNSQRWYRVRSFYDADGNDIGSDATVDSETVVVTGVIVWITDPLDPTNIHMTVEPTSERERTWKGREVVHEPADMALAVVETEVATRRDTVSFLAVDPGSHDEMVRLFDSGRTLLYRDDRREHFYFRWVGDRSRRQVGGRRIDADIFTASQVEVGRPRS